MHWAIRVEDRVLFVWPHTEIKIFWVIFYHIIFFLTWATQRVAPTAEIFVVNSLY